MTKEELLEIISPNAIFTVDFIKKDGTLRTMNCRMGVKKHLRGGSSTTSHLKNLLTVWDLKAQGYRNISLDKVKRLVYNHQEYSFN